MAAAQLAAEDAAAACDTVWQQVLLTCLEGKAAFSSVSHHAADQLACKSQMLVSSRWQFSCQPCAHMHDLRLHRLVSPEQLQAVHVTDKGNLQEVSQLREANMRLQSSLDQGASDLSQAKAAAEQAAAALSAVQQQSEAAQASAGAQLEPLQQVWHALYGSTSAPCMREHACMSLALGNRPCLA